MSILLASHEANVTGWSQVNLCDIELYPNCDSVLKKYTLKIHPNLLISHLVE